MLSLINTLAIVAVAFSSIASGAPTASPSATPSLGASTVLAPVHGSKPFFIPTDALKERAEIPRAAAVEDSKIILAPISSTGTFLIPADSLKKRDASVIARRATPLVPSTNVTLDFQSVGTSSMMLAQINATMKHPSILLEDIESVTKVDCSAKSVNVTFGNAADYEESLTAWPASSFILFTNHLGDCDVDNERGLYVVDKMTFDATTHTIMAATTKSTFGNSTDDVDVVFTKPVSIAKRGVVTSTFLGDLPGTLTLNDNPTTKTLSISVESPKIGGSIALSGHLKYNFFKAKASKFSVDLDMTMAASANVKVVAGVAYDNDVYSFSPADISVSAFSIPGILDVGPRLEFALGVEVAVSGQVEISADLTADLAAGHVHVDFLDSKNTVATGWTPVYTHQTNISATIDAQVNPYVELTAAIGVNFLGGLLDLSSGVKARPQLINDFSLNGKFDISNSGNVTIPASTDGTCVNGLWYSSAFTFGVTAFVTQFYELELYRLDVSIYESGCWTWAKPL